MITEQDSTQVAVQTEAPSTSTAPSHHNGYHSPAQILSWLPETATPWQQDSAIRANYKFVEKDWLHMHNPMRTPTTKADPKLSGNLTKPLYHSHSLVQPDSVYRPEYAVYRRGVAGDPVPYTIAGDSLVTSVLLFCFVIATITIAQAGHFLERQLKNFFRTQREGTTVITETSNEMRFQLFLVAQTCMLLAIILFIYSHDFARESFAIAHYQMLGLFTAVNMAYFVVKFLLYSIVDWVFFDRKKNIQWMKSFLFIISTEGILLFPIVLLFAFFHISVSSAVIYTLFVVLAAKILSFYKTYIIFFAKETAILQSFLYFCALELMPLGMLYGIMTAASGYLKTIF
jgi:hypothetical protein